MAVPKKKSSKSRRNMRRFAGGNRLKKVTLITDPLTSEPTRPHRVTVETAAAYIEERTKRKAAKRAAAKTI
jgi:ribosomal protein L32